MRAKIAAYAAGTLAYLAWSKSGRHPPVGAVQSGLGSIESFRRNRQRGNLLVVEPAMEPKDYGTEPRFASKLDLSMQAAQERGWLNAATVVVYPEHLATWLILVGEKQSVSRSRHQGSALGLMLASNALRVLPWLRTQAQSGPKGALFHLKARLVGQIWSRTMRELARKYGVTIVGGSAILPNPTLDAQGQSGVRSGVPSIVPRNGPLMNVSAIFTADGRIGARFPRLCAVPAADRVFLQPAFPVHLPVFDTPAGRVGVLLGHDALDEKCWDVLGRQGVDVVVNPASLPHQSATQPWLNQQFFSDSYASAFAAAFERPMWDRKGFGSAVLALRQDVYEGSGPLELAQQGGRLANLWR